MPKTVSLHAVNILYLIVLVLVVAVGSLLQQLSTGVGLLLTELLLILLPALLILRREKLPFLETVRFTFPGFRVMFLALLAGLGFSFFSSLLATAVTQLLGYTFEMPPGMFSSDPLNAVLVFISLAVLAPLCEETLFRGLILPAYERYGSLRAVLLVGFTFALFHLSLVRLLALIPVALVLTWLAWRTRSVVSSMLMHFSYNWISAAALLMVTLFGASEDLARAAAGSSATVNMVLGPGLFGLLVGALSLVGIELLVRRSQSPSALLPIAPAVETRLPLRNIWALVLAVVIGLGIAGAEFLLSRNQQAKAQEPLALAAGDWSETVSWDYRMVNAAGDWVGDAKCGRFSTRQGYRFHCSIWQKAFELQQQNSYFKMDTYDGRIEVLWAADDLHLLDGTGSESGDTRTLSYTIEPGSAAMELFTRNGEKRYEALALPHGALLQDDWAWRLQGMHFEQGLARKVEVAFPLTYVEAEQAARPLVKDGQVKVVGRETVKLPTGEQEAWRVTYDRQTAWYAVDDAHTLLKLDNGMVVFELMSIE